MVTITPPPWLNPPTPAAEPEPEDESPEPEPEDESPEPASGPSDEVFRDPWGELTETPD
jgi:hypothetical protein